MPDCDAVWFCEIGVCDSLLAFGQVLNITKIKTRKICTLIKKNSSMKFYQICNELAMHCGNNMKNFFKKY